MDCLTLPRLHECGSTFEESRNKNYKQLMKLCEVVYTNFGLVVDCNVTPTLTLILTLNKEKGKFFDPNVCLKRI